MDASTLASAESWLSVITIAKLLAAALVAVGVAIEFAAEWGARPFEKIVAEAGREQIAALNKQAAEASERAAKVERENIELREKMTGRRISEIQHDIIVKALSKQQSTFDINVVSEGEASLLASDIIKTLTDAGWVIRNRELPIDKSWFGIAVSVSPDAASVQLLEAFQAAHVPVGWFTDKGHGDVPTIWVGSKPSPF